MELSAQQQQRMDKLSTDDQLKLKAIMQMMAKEKDAIEKDARKAKGMMEDRPYDRRNAKGIGQLNVQPAVVDEIGFHIDAYKEGTIDVDDMIQAIEEIIYGKVVAPGDRFAIYNFFNCLNHIININSSFFISIYMESNFIYNSRLYIKLPYSFSITSIIGSIFHHAFCFSSIFFDSVFFFCHHLHYSF
jgi:hypothetical protein